MIALIIFLLIYEVILILLNGEAGPYDSIIGPVTFLVLQYSKRQTTEMTKLRTTPAIPAHTNGQSVEKTVLLKASAALTPTAPGSQTAE